MQTAKQLSVSLVNKPGRLAAMLTALNKEKVSFRALVVMDSGVRGTVRFVPDNLATATDVLEKLSIRYEATNVLLVEVPKQAGAFRKNLRAPGGRTPQHRLRLRLVCGTRGQGGRPGRVQDQQPGQVAEGAQRERLGEHAAANPHAPTAARTVVEDGDQKPTPLQPVGSGERPECRHGHGNSTVAATQNGWVRVRAET